MLRRAKNTKERRKKMEKHNVVVTFNISPEQKALFLEMLNASK